MIITQLNEISANFNIILNIILAIVIPLVFYQLIRITINRFLDEDTLSSSSINVLFKIVRYFIILIIFLSILDVLGIDLHSLIVSVGLVSLAVTLAAKDTLSNVISGTMILIDKKFVVGDMIEIDGYKGQVKKIGLKSVELYHKKKYTVIPNVLFTTKPFINHTRNGYYAIYFDVKILNRYNLDEKIAQLEDVLDNSDLILKEPKYLIMIKNITTSGVDIKVKVYIDDPNNDNKITSELIKKIKRDIVLEDMY